MVTIQSIKEQFDEFGLEPSDEIVEKCIQICNRHGVVDPVEFVEQWFAYSCSKLGGAEPTLENLRDMESHEYANRSRKPAANPSLARVRHGEVAVVASSSGSGGSRASTSGLEAGDLSGRSGGGGGGGSGGLVIYSNAEENEVENEVLGSYGCHTPKTKKRPVSRLLAQTPDKPNKAQFAPASYSPIAPSKKSADEEQPSNSGNVVYTFGNAFLLKQTSWSSTATAGARPALSILAQMHQRSAKAATVTSDDLPKCMGDACKYMYDSNYDRVLILGDRIYEGGREICQRLAETRKQQRERENGASAEEEAIPEDDREATLLEQVAIHHVDYPSTDVITVLGRIAVHPERQEGGRLAIVDYDEMTLRYTKLDFSKLKSWSVFPGETVVLEGVNPRGNLFEVRKVHYEVPLAPPPAPTTLGKPLHMVIGAAPFTDKDNLQYDKLSDLLAYCAENNPDVLILTGPFGSTSNDTLFLTIAESFEEYFEKIMANIVTSVPPTTEILIVSNHDDLQSSFVYPSFPYKISKFYKNLHFLPDPCVVSINGMHVAITTVDVVRDLSEAELSVAPSGDKIKRAFNYMFHHRSFYPLNPPPESVPLDVDLLHHFGTLPRVPNVMICPGDLKPYVRDVNGCVCVNPGHLTDYDSGEGTFVRVVVHPPEEPTAAPFSYVACQVVKS